MSRVYFHSPSGDAELRGSERAWLNHVARGPAEAAWNFDHTDIVDRITHILAMVPEVPDGEFGSNYLHTGLRAAQQEQRANKAAYQEWRPGQPLRGPVSHEHRRLLVRFLRTRLSVDGVELHVAGVKLHSSNVELNTALVAGSDPVRLAAKIHGWCESHAWVEGPDRAWLAGIIDQGLKAGIYRRAIRHSDEPDGELYAQGWEQVQELLRARDDKPIVLSYSVCDQFPNPTTDLASPHRQVDRWEDYTEAEQQAVTDWQERWYEDDNWAAKWDKGMAWLRERRPWARLAPDTLADVAFHLPVTVYDLFAPDRDERVRAAAGLSSERVEAE
ncbi:MULTISPECIES: hypothetical protein [unclassified Micromonospora]|uniref:hypothetical protein n=1 Tax=unclassified Micromonospora TaxID=2617518 RepID=UPI00331B0AD9